MASLVKRVLFCSLLLVACSPELPPTAAPVATMTQPTAPAPETTGRPTILGPEASPVDIERIARFPEPGWQTPRSVTFSPDGKLVTYLQSESQSDEMALFAFDLATRATRVLVRASDLVKSERPLSREEELRRERRRTRIAGVTDYRWAKKAQAMILPHAGEALLPRRRGCHHPAHGGRRPGDRIPSSATTARRSPSCATGSSMSSTCARARRRRSPTRPPVTPVTWAA